MAFPTVDYDLSNRTDVPSSLGGKAIQMVRFSKSITTAMLAVGIVTKLGELPTGSRIVGGYLEVPDLDSNGAPTLTIGIGYRATTTTDDDVDGILDAVTTGQAGGLNTTFLTAGVDRQFAYDTDITFTAEAGAATAVAGTVVLVLFVVLP